MNFYYLTFIEYAFNPTAIVKEPSAMPIMFTNAISEDLANKDNSPLDNSIPTSTTAGI